MGTPDTSGVVDAWIGYDSGVLAGIAAAASNIRIGDNPPYAVSDFLAAYPQFGSLDDQGNYAGPLNLAILQIYVNLASASVNQARWQEWWTMGIGLFIAHFCTLFLRASAPAGSSAQQIVAQAVAIGIQVSKSVGPISVSYQPISGLEDWASWNLTLWGQQFATLGEMVGRGPMQIW